MQIEEFNHIVQELKDKMYRLALRLVKDPEEARDVVQDALVKIWTKWEKLEHINNKAAYCMTITRNVGIDKIRSKRMKTTDIDEHYDIQSGTANPEKLTIVKDEFRRVKKVIDNLPENHRTVIQLRDIEGYSYKEIVEITGFSQEKVKVYLHRARTRLKQHFKKRVS